MITGEPISPELIVDEVKTGGSGCVVAYIGLIRDHSCGKPVLSVEYTDDGGRAERRLLEIADEINQRWAVENVAICHRTGKLKVGDINLVVAIASAHRKDGLDACQYAIDSFKQRLPTRKAETYQDGSVRVEDGGS